MNQWSTVQLDQFQDDTKKLALKSMDELAETKEAQAKVARVYEEHLIEKDIEECATLSTKLKEEIE